MIVKFDNTTKVSYTHLKNIVSKDDLRPVMKGAYIDFKEQKIVVTDAHIIIAYPIEITENDSDLEGLIIPIDYFNRLRYMVALPNKSKLVLDIEYILTDNYAEIHWLGEMIYRTKYIEGKFPSWNSENVFIDPNDYPVKPSSIGVTANLMKRVLLGLPNLKSGILKMETTTKTKGILFSSQGCDYPTPIKAILMPAMLINE